MPDKYYGILPAVSKNHISDLNRLDRLFGLYLENGLPLPDIDNFRTQSENVSQLNHLVLYYQTEYTKAFNAKVEFERNLQIAADLEASGQLTPHQELLELL